MKLEVHEREEKNWTCENVKNIIREKIEKEQSTLDEIIWYIQEAGNINLSTVDHTYIEHKYIKYCSKLWLEEVINFLIEVRKDNVEQKDIARDIISKISVIQNINQIPTYLGKLQYYDLLLKHYHLIDKERERIILGNFKKQCLDILIECNDTAKQELTFLETLKDFLNSFETLEVITKKLFLSEFYKGDISFHKLLKIIIDLEATAYGEKFIALQNAAKFLKDQGNFLLTDEIREISGSYIVPINVLIKQLDNRSIIEIKGRIININEILAEVESHLTNTKNDVDEVHFVGSDSIHIRVGLENDIWHGKNIVIYTNVIKVHNVVTWDVSGKNVSHKYPDNAGTDMNGHGINGADGYAGESGGNVKIFAKSIENPKNWTIISNGGRGGDGQDGGNGKDGPDGKGIQVSTFRNQFPSVVSFMCPRHKRTSQVNEMVDYIERLGRIETNWKSDGNIFLKVVTNEGNEITFSYCTGSFTTRYQAFLLYGGSVGKPGGDGGKCGLGGQGGYPGEINVCNSDVKVQSKSGQNGDKGKGGLFGNHGRNAWDVAYVDYQHWRDPMFYGMDMQSKLTVNYYGESNADGTRVWCVYKNAYAEIKARRIDNKKQKMFEERQKDSNNRALQKQALAARKKAIISTSFTVYSEYCNRANNILENLKFNLEQTACSLLQIMHEHEKERKKQEINVEVNTRRVATSTHGNNGKKSSFLSRLGIMKIFKKAEKEKEDTLIETLRDSESFHDWVAIKNRSVSYSDLKQLFVIFNKIREKKFKNLQRYKKQNIEKILISKYKFAVLQEIGTHLSLYQSSSSINDQRSLSLNMAKYLIVSKVNNKVSHNILGSLNQYIFNDGDEQRHKICKFLKEHVNETNYETLKHSMKAFILESKDTEKISPFIEKYRNEYLEHLQKKLHNVNLSLEMITKEVQRRNGLYDLWIECIADKSKEHILEGRMKEDKFLFTLYCRFKDQFKEEFDWNVCYADKLVLQEYNKHIVENGFVSTSYRELVACLFDISIKIYNKNKNNRFWLLHNHNSSSERSIHILQRNNEYIELEIDKDYLQLDEERKWKDNLYARILKDVEVLTEKKKLDKYLECRTFLSPSIIGNEKVEWPNEEDVYFDEILKYFSDETDDRSQIRRRLEKLKYQFLGQGGFLYCIAQRFLNEGRHVSTELLYYLINSILNNVIQNEEETYIFHWIITSYSQHYWIVELTLLQLENYFKKPLTVEQVKWRERLPKINEEILMLLKVKLDREESVSIQCIDDILYLLSSIPNEVRILKDLGLSEWPYFLKEQYWVFKLTKLMSWQENDELVTASYYVLSVENSFGTAVVEKLLELMQAKKQKFSSKNLIYILCNFHNENWQLNENTLSSFSESNLADWMKTMEEKVKLTGCCEERSVVQLIPLIQNNSNTSSRIFSILPKIKGYILDRSASVEHDTLIGKEVDKFTENDIEKWVNCLNDLKNDANTPKDIKCYIKERYAKVLAVIDKAIELKRGFKLRDTQKLSALTLLVNENSTLEQVSTGEGKSLIVVAVSIVKALCGEKVDIVTSSSVLAKRDAEENKSIYKLFNIGVSHNCAEIIEKRKAAYSDNQVVYGDLSSFQRDYLLDRFYKRNILGNRTFDNVIVDEVDSMLLDKGNNMLYLSHDLAGVDKLESVYIYIWQLINKPCESFEDFRRIFDPKVIEEAVLYDLYGLIDEQDIKKVDDNLTNEEAIALWGCLVDANIVDNRGRLLLKESVSVDRIKNILPERFSCYVVGLHYLINETINRDRLIDVPNYLKAFIEEHLEVWINNARMALSMRERYDYIVDIDRSGTSFDRNPQIIILDRDTGTDQVNSEWEEALHQFLQLKHGCKLSLQNLKAVFISNVSYIKLYSNLYGLSGTLGLHGERSLLEDVYKVDFVIVPTAKPKQFYEMKPIVCKDKEEWTNEICQMANKLTVEKLRSVLIICETVKEVEELYASFGGKAAKNVHTYVRDYEEFNIAKGNKEMEQKQIIIATNLAGRGTDIKITEALSEAGGLHVCLTYLPSNARVEEQAFGRAARSGNKGSGQLIIINSEEKQIFRLRKQRDIEELCRISRMKDHYEKQTLVEESHFSRFKEQYEKLDKHLDESKISDELKSILLQSCLDEWAFWLDRNNKHIKNTMEDKRKEILDESSNRFIDELHSKCKKEDWSAWVKDHPCHMLKLGVYFAKMKMYDKAIDLFDKIIKQEPNFSAAAHYYKAFAMGKKIDWEKKNKHEQEIKEFKEHLQTVLKRLDLRQNTRMCAASIVKKLNGFNNEGIVKIDAYMTQQEKMNEILSLFSKTIDDIFGHQVISQQFIGLNVDESLAITLYEDMIEMGILESPKVSESIPKVALNKISQDFGLQLEKLSAFLYTFEGKDINERSFIKKLKENIVMPSREAFWKLLITKGILTDEITYVLLNKDKLKNCDPSSLDILLKEKTNEKSEDDLISKDFKQVFLYPKQVNADTNNILLEKNYIIRTMGKDKYYTFKKFGIFSSNKVARVNTEEVKSIIFPHYDSITINDFNKIDIAAEEAEKILAELVSKEVLVSDDSNKNTYRLLAPYTKIRELELSFRPVYEGNVKVLLSVCFTYRIALQRMMEDLTEDGNQLSCFQLAAKPHKSLFCSLMDESIVICAKVTTKCDDLKSKLTNKYCKNVSEIDILRILKQSRLIPFEFCDTALWNDFIKKEWILVHSLMKDGSLSVTDMYSINNNSCKKRKPLDLMYRDIEKTLHLIMDNLERLSKDETIANIVSTLEQLKGSLNTLDCPDFNLKPLLKSDVTNFSNIEEIRIFIVNGFDELLTIEEKKYTKKMLFNTGLVIAMGICQITVGVLIELFSVGIMTHVGAAFINEGISDIIFATSALTSGYFSWKDYRQHKLQSMIMTFLTLGVAAYLSRGIKVSHFGHKVAGTSLELSQKNVSQMAGKQLFQAIGKSTTNVVRVSLTKEVFKRITVKTLQGIAFGLSSGTADLLLQKYLHSFCDSLTFTILSDVEKHVAEHPGLSSTIRESYKVLGKVEARTMINSLITIMSKEESYTENLSSIAKKMYSSITQGVMQAVEKASKLNKSIGNALLVTKVISEVLKWSERAVHLGNISLSTDAYLEQVEKKIRTQLDYKKSVNVKQVTEATDEEYKEFEREIIDQWKLILRQKAEQVITQQIIGPIIKGFAEKLMHVVGKMIKVMYRGATEYGYFREFQKLKRDYQITLKNISEQKDAGDIKQMKEQATVEYHNNLIQLMAKTRNPYLFAAIVDEGVPMETVCLNSCVKVIPIALKKKGFIVQPFTLNVEGEDGIRQNISSQEGINGQCINLKLKDNHFTLCGSDFSNINESNMSPTDDENNESRNNCLFEALKRAIPELNNLTAQEFRKCITNYIRNDPSVEYFLSQAWHRLPLAYNFIGGDRRETRKITSKELKEKIKDGTFKFSQSSVATHTKEKGIHIGELSKNIQENKWEGDPVRVMETSEGKYVTVDHRRVLAVAISDDPNVEMEMAVYGPDDEFSSENNNELQQQQNESAKRNYEKTAGGLVKKRMRSGSLEFNDTMDGFSIDQVKIRLRKSNSNLAKEAEKRLEELGCQMGGPRRNSKVYNKGRSKSLNR